MSSPLSLLDDLESRYWPKSGDQPTRITLPFSQEQLIEFSAKGIDEGIIAHGIIRLGDLTVNDDGDTR